MKMNSANGEKAAFAEKELLNATYLPTSYLTLGARELNAKEDQSKSIKMTRIQHFCFTLLALALIITIAAATTGNPDGSRPAPLSTDEQKFQDLLNSVEPSALHDILHEHFKDKYQHGVYQEDKTAMEAVHQQNAEVAKSLIELAKRQAGTSSNGTGIVTTTTAVTTEVTETVSVTSINTPKPPTSETTSTTPTTAPTTQPTTTPTTTSIPTRTPTSTNTAETSTPSSTSPPATTGSGTSRGGPAANSFVPPLPPPAPYPSLSTFLPSASVYISAQNCSSMDSHPSDCNCASSPMLSSSNFTSPTASTPSNSSSSNATVISPTASKPYNYSSPSNATITSLSGYVFNSTSGPSPTYSNTSSSSSSSSSLNTSTSSILSSYSSLMIPPYSNNTSNSLAASSSSPSQEPSRSSPSSEDSVTQSIVYTTTQADGAPSTVTQITVVPADQAAGQTNGVGGTGTNTANASLQTNSASISSHHLGLGVCVGVLGLAVSWTL
jgi:hypothetical protein